MMSAPTISYKNHHFPPQIIAHAAGCISGFRQACGWFRSSSLKDRMHQA